MSGKQTLSIVTHTLTVLSSCLAAPEQQIIDDMYHWRDANPFPVANMLFLFFKFHALLCFNVGCAKSTFSCSTSKSQWSRGRSKTSADGIWECSLTEYFENLDGRTPSSKALFVEINETCTYFTNLIGREFLEFRKTWHYCSLSRLKWKLISTCWKSHQSGNFQF